MRFPRTILFLVLAHLLSGKMDGEEEYSMPKEFSELHSNLGLQNIVEVVPGRKFNWIGPTPDELYPGSIPLGSLSREKETEALLKGEVPEWAKEILQPAVLPKRKIEGWVGSLPSEVRPGSVPLGSLRDREFIEVQDLDDRVKQFTDEENKQEDIEPESSKAMNFGMNAGMRAYLTSNVLRVNSDEMKSGVMETSLGASHASRPFAPGDYLIIAPRFDFMMQWANYQKDSVSDLLDYRFGMVKAGIDFRFPKEWSLSFGLEYDFLHSQSTGDKMFDAVAPSLGLQKIFLLGETTFMMLNGGVKYSATNKEIPFQAPGVFADDGDNLQSSLTLSLIQTFLEQSQVVLSPTIGLTNTHYLRNLHEGRNDLIFTAGISALWQAAEFFAIQLFVNYSTMSTNSIGDALLGPSSQFGALDYGASLNANYQF